MLTNKVRTYSVLKAQTLILPLHPLLLIHNVVRSPFIFSLFGQFSKVGFFWSREGTLSCKFWSSVGWCDLQECVPLCRINLHSNLILIRLFRKLLLLILYLLPKSNKGRNCLLSLSPLFRI